MALAKVTIEALTQMANTLRQSADDILLTKEQMDTELYSIPWDDPIGLSFINRYEEDFKPLKENLIPNIEQYLEYIYSLSMDLDAYSSENGGIPSGIGLAAGVAAGVGLTGLNNSSQTGVQGGQLKQPKVDFYLKANKDGTISWDDKRFKRLEKENAAYLESEDGKLMQKRAKAAFSKIDDLSTLTYGQLHQVVGGTLGLKEGEIEYKMLEKDSPNTLGWHPRDSKEAILNANQRATMPVCEQIATFAHEGRHVYQDMIINSSSDSDYAKDMRFGRAVYKSAKEDYQQYYHNPLEVDARKIEVIVGKECTERHNKLIQMKLSKPRRWNPSDYYQK